MANWENFLKNLGEWQGSFTRLSPQGEVLGVTPSILTLEGLEDNKLVNFRLRRYSNFEYQDPPTQDYSQEYRALGRQIIFFETGAFSKGAWQLAPFTEFGAEFGFVDGDRRMRFVQLYNKQSELDSLTFIREFRRGSDAVERPTLTVEQLLGTWHCQAYTAYPDWREPEVTSLEITLTRQGDSVEQRLTMGKETFLAQGDIADGQINFTTPVPSKLLLLPDGTSSRTSDRLQVGTPFFGEIGWLVRPNERQRLIRYYDNKGAWSHSTFIVEHRQ